MLSECESGKHEDDLKRSEEFMSGAKSLQIPFKSFARKVFQAFALPSSLRTAIARPDEIDPRSPRNQVGATPGRADSGPLEKASVPLGLAVNLR
jgi:hypothetical protein